MPTNENSVVDAIVGDASSDGNKFRPPQQCWYCTAPAAVRQAVDVVKLRYEASPATTNTGKLADSLRDRLQFSISRSCIWKHMRGEYMCHS